MNVKIFFARLLMVIGGLTAIFAGGCTVMMYMSMLAKEAKGIESAITSPAIILIGNVPFVIGLVIFFLGRKLYKKSSQQRR